MCIQKNVEIWPYIHKWLFQHWTVPLRVQKKKKSIVPAMQQSQHRSKGHKEIIVYKTKASYYWTTQISQIIAFKLDCTKKK